MFSNFNEFINSVKNTVSSTICLNNTRLLPRTLFEEQLNNLDQHINRDIDEENSIDESTNNQNIHIFNGNSAVIYVRASTKEQNIEAQKHACEEFCIKNKLNVIKCYIEKCSAYKQFSQPKLNQLLYTHDNINLIVFSVDRFSRNVKKSDNTIKSLENKNIVLISVKENINLNTAFGKHSFRAHVNAAQYESELISERVKNSVKYRKDNNIHVGQAPYGYRLENKKLIQDQSERTIMSFIVRNYSKQKTSDEISRQLFNILRVLRRPESDFVPVLFTNENDKYEFYQYKKQEKIKITASIISEILNDYNIKKRNRKWTPGSVTYTLRTTINSAVFKQLKIN